ncbi:ABC transporter ATP-binding protein [uncultured Microbacterium sp.]|uniref:ABC transporter ATP-binding protein n=1 Tax=uncultured Microbacterium sp. TaxID=191216 RepID=UPI00261252CB|nr:ABC transporter ATP-binding protein [uncultured Microbacterium sp.]
MALLEVSGLSCEIRLSKSVVHALDGVSFTVEAGETVGIVGESGSGKTMTAMSIERLLPPGGHLVGGSVLFDGEDLVTLPEKRMQRIRGGDIGMIFQDPMTSLNPVQTIGEQVAEPLLLHRSSGTGGLNAAQVRDQVLEMLRLVGIPHPEQRVNAYPHQLSGGQRQRVMIAMALICHPKLLIADEPTTALDVTVQKQILELIDRLREEFGMAVILITHDLGVVAGRADRVVVMYAGKVAETAETQTLFDRPRHRYTEALFEALPERAAGTGERLYSIPGLPPDLIQPLTACPFARRCRFATEQCRTEMPLLETAGDGDPTHAFACFVPRDEPLVSVAEAVAGTLSDSAPIPDAAVQASAALDSPDAETPASFPIPVGASVAALVSADERDWVAPTRFIPADGTPLLELDDLVKDFPVTSGGLLRRRVGAVSAVAGANLRIERGQSVGLVGESGCGKTTLGRLIVGLELPTSGRILFRGRERRHRRRRDLREDRRNVQFMFQDAYASLDPRMRVRSILREPLEIQGVGTARDRDNRVDELLEDVGLPHSAAERYPHEFSGGQRQRVGLARALALQPALIVADEPVSALDVSIQAQVLNLMTQLQRERELTYLFISHDLSVVRYLCDRIAVMYLGKIVEIGPAAEVYAAPRHPYTRGLIDAVPVADPVAERAKAKLGVSGELPSAMDPPSGCRFRTRCPIAQDICAQVEPRLRVGGGSAQDAGEPGDHLVACHFPLQLAAAGGPASFARPEGLGPVHETHHA